MQMITDEHSDIPDFCLSTTVVDRVENMEQGRSRIAVALHPCYKETETILIGANSQRGRAVFVAEGKQIAVDGVLQRHRVDSTRRDELSPEGKPGASRGLKQSKAR
jgi:hypothetical protein